MKHSIKGDCCHDHRADRDAAGRIVATLLPILSKEDVTPAAMALMDIISAIFARHGITDKGLEAFCRDLKAAVKDKQQTLADL